MTMTPSETKAEKAEREAQEAADAALADAAAGAPEGEPIEGKSVKIKVGQDDGEIVLSRGGDVVLTKTVKDGHVTANDDDELAVLLGSVPGAVRVDS